MRDWLQSAWHWACYKITDFIHILFGTCLRSYQGHNIEKAVVLTAAALRLFQKRRNWTLLVSAKGNYLWCTQSNWQGKLPLDVSQKKIISTHPPVPLLTLLPGAKARNITTPCRVAYWGDLSIVGAYRLVSLYWDSYCKNLCNHTKLYWYFTEVEMQPSNRSCKESIKTICRLLSEKLKQ